MNFAVVWSLEWLWKQDPSHIDLLSLKSDNGRGRCHLAVWTNCSGIQSYYLGNVNALVTDTGTGLFRNQKLHWWQLMHCDATARSTVKKTWMLRWNWQKLRRSWDEPDPVVVWSKCVTRLQSLATHHLLFIHVHTSNTIWTTCCFAVSIGSSSQRWDFFIFFRYLFNLQGIEYTYLPWLQWNACWTVRTVQPLRRCLHDRDCSWACRPLPDPKREGPCPRRLGHESLLHDVLFPVMYTTIVQ